MSRLELRMPQMGVSVTEGTVTVWHKQPGDAVKADEPVCDVATDKVDTEVVAPADGALAEILVGVGETVAVGAALAMIAVAGDAEPAPAPPEATVALAATATAPFAHEHALAGTLLRTGRREGPLASPVARRLADDLGVDLARVRGTGARGRIRKADVLAAGEATPVARNGAGADLPAGYEDVPHDVVPTSHIRRQIADHMIRSRQTAAHMTTEVEVDMAPVAAVRAAINALRIEQGLPKLSYLPFITRVACHALRQHPDINATFERERFIRWKDVNVGIAVDTPRGLLVPVLRRAHAATVDELGDRIADLALAARERRLDADAFRAGTFTITNPGSVGAVSAMAIINQPQVAILGMPAIVRRPWVVALPDGTETIAIRPILALALTFDHRAIDGAEATRAAVLMKRSLESWGEQDYR